MKRAIRFVHASDLHLDATFGGVDASDERVSAALLTLEDLAYDRPRRERPTPRILIERPTTNQPLAIPPVDID